MPDDQNIRTLYVDHQIIAKEANWPQLSDLLERDKSLRLAISIYNLAEISSASDKAQALRCVEFVDSLKPLWVLERLIVQKYEVRNFLWQHHFHKEPNSFAVFTDRLSTALSYHLGPKVPLGMNARRWVELFVNVEELNPVKKVTVDSLITLQAADKKQKKSDPSRCVSRVGASEDSIKRSRWQVIN
jgi:hypothetical protein